MMRTSAASACRCRSLLPSPNLFTAWWRWYQWFWYDEVGEMLSILRLRSIFSFVVLEAHVPLVGGGFRRTPLRSHLIHLYAFKITVTICDLCSTWRFMFSSGSRMRARILSFGGTLKLASLFLWCYSDTVTSLQLWEKGRKQYDIHICILCWCDQRNIVLQSREMCDRCFWCGRLTSVCLCFLSLLLYESHHEELILMERQILSLELLLSKVGIISLPFQVSVCNSN